MVLEGNKLLIDVARVIFREKHKVGEPSETTVTNEPDGKSEYAHSQDQHGAGVHG